MAVPRLQGSEEGSLWARPVCQETRRAESVPTLKDCAKTVHAANLKTWRNGKHTAQWLNTREAYAYPTIGMRPINKSCNTIAVAHLSADVCGEDKSCIAASEKMSLRCDRQYSNNFGISW